MPTTLKDAILEATKEVVENVATSEGNEHVGHEGQRSTNGRGGADEGDVVDRVKISERFHQNTKCGLKPDVQEQYDDAFRIFWERAKLEGITKQKLSTRRGKDALLDYLVTRPIKSRFWHRKAIKKVWEQGLEMPFPLAESDLGKPPECGRGMVPPNDTIQKWNDALSKEPNPYFRVYWGFAMEGWRLPSHPKNLTWGDLSYDEKGIPTHIIVDGVAKDFKTGARLAAWFPQAIRDDLVAWRKELNPAMTDLILPNIDYKDRPTGENMNRQRHTTIWNRIRKRWRLPRLTARECRHWVCKVCRDAHMREQARALMQGHKEPHKNMGDHYDYRSIEECLDEQASLLPNGAVGVLLGPMVTIESKIPPEVAQAWMNLEEGRIDLKQHERDIADILIKRLRTRPPNI